MVHYPPMLAHWLSLWYTLILYLPNDNLYGTLLSSTGPLYPYDTLPSPIGPLSISMLQYNLLEAHSLSQWYTILPYWPSGYPYGTLLASTCPMDISMVHYTLLLSHWLYLWYTTIFHWSTGYPRYTTIFYWPTGYLFGTLQSSTGPLAILTVHFSLLLAHWLSLWYTIFPYWLTGYPYGTLLSSTGSLDISLDHYPLILAH